MHRLRRTTARCRSAASLPMPDGRIVGRGRNRREKGRSALAHAELEAIGEACRTLGGWRLWQCTLYVTLEPCCMVRGGNHRRADSARGLRCKGPQNGSRRIAGQSSVSSGVFSPRGNNRRSRRGVPGTFADLFPLASRKKETVARINER